MVLNPTHPDTLRMNSKKIGFDIASLVGKDSMEESRMRREMALLAPHFDSHKFDVRYRPYARNTARSRHSEADLQNDGQKKHRYSPKHHSDTEAEHEHVAKVQEGGFRIKSEASPNLPTSRYPVASMENEHRLKFLHNTNVANSRSQPVASPRQFSPISPTRHMRASYVEEKAQVRSASSEYPSAISASSPNQDRLSLSAPTMYPGAHNGLKPALGFPYQLTPYNNDPATAAIIDRIFLQAAAAASGMRQPGSTPVMPASIPTTCVPALPPMPVAARHPFIPTPTSPWLMKQTPIHPLQYTDALLRSRFELMMANPFQRKPKRIRTAFTPGQLLQLEHEFDKNHYVVGTERKQLARSLKLSETQVKVWFQNRRTKYKREKIDDKSSSGERSQSPEEIEEPDEIDLNEEDEAQIDKEEAEYERMRQQQHMNKSKIEEMASNHAMYIKPERIDE